MSIGKKPTAHQQSIARLAKLPPFSPKKNIVINRRRLEWPAVQTKRLVFRRNNVVGYGYSDAGGDVSGVVTVCIELDSQIGRHPNIPQSVDILLMRRVLWLNIDYCLGGDVLGCHLLLPSS